MKVIIIKIIEGATGMKINIFTFLTQGLLAIVFVLCQVHSLLGATGSGYIMMNITVRDDTCTITSGASTTLDFGKILLSDFVNINTRKRATINLTCPDSTSKIKATLNGTPETTNNTYFKNMGTASVAVRVYKADTYTILSNGSSWEVNVNNKTATFSFDVVLLGTSTISDMKTGTIQIPLSVTFSYS